MKLTREGPDPWMMPTSPELPSLPWLTPFSPTNKKPRSPTRIYYPKPPWEPTGVHKVLLFAFQRWGQSSSWLSIDIKVRIQFCRHSSFNLSAPPAGYRTFLFPSALKLICENIQNVRGVRGLCLRENLTILRFEMKFVLGKLTTERHRETSLVRIIGCFPLLEEVKTVSE